MPLRINRRKIFLSFIFLYRVNTVATLPTFSILPKKHMTQSFELLSYEYHLPEALIAQSSVQPHHNARLMVVDRETGDICDETTYFDLDRLIPPDRVLFFNNSRVLRARVSFSSVDFFHKNEIHAQRADGEIFFLKLVDNDRFEALVRPGKRFKLGTRFILFGRTFSVISMTDE